MPLMDDTTTVLSTAYLSPFTTKSDFARAHATAIAYAACGGLLTARRPDGAWGNIWRITARGLDRLEHPDAYW